MSEVLLGVFGFQSVVYYVYASRGLMVMDTDYMIREFWPALLLLCVSAVILAAVIYNVVTIYYLPYRTYKAATSNFSFEFFILNTFLGITLLGWGFLMLVAVSEKNRR